MRNVVWAALLIINMLYTPHASQELNVDESQRQVGYVDGDFTIGALISVREDYNISYGQVVRCGKIRDQYGMQRVEATLRAIKIINRDKNILPNNYTLGIHIRDTCWNPRLALRQSLQFIDFCPSKSTDINATTAGSIIGVIGPPSSEETDKVHSLLEIFGIPQVGFSATSSSFSGSNYFVRVVPSDRYQALAMVQILLKFNWTYVNAIGSAGQYGENGLKVFKQLAKINGVCIQQSEQLLTNTTAKDYDEIFRTFRVLNTSKVIICFCDGEIVREILLAAQRADQSHSYVFIGSDGWAGRDDVVKDVETVAEGNLMIRIKTSSVPDFKEYYFKMGERFLQNHSRNPWTEEFFRQQFNCTFNKAENGKQCTGDELSQSEYIEDPKLPFVVKSVYVFAYAMSKFVTEVCEKNRSVSCMDLMNSDPVVFMRQYVKKVNFTYQGEMVNFNEAGDPLASYEIVNYRFYNGSYQYIPVGSWVNDELTLEMDKIQLPGNASSIKSICSDPCRRGQKKVILAKKCCWECKPCEKNEYSNGLTENCTKCEPYQMPMRNMTGCVKKVIQLRLWWKTDILICVCISAIGISVTLSSAAVFYKFQETPVVKLASKELSFIMFSGMIVAYISTYWILTTPTDLSCHLNRVLPGVSLTMMYAPLLVKSNRVARIFSNSKKRFPKLRPKYLSTKFQVLACIILILMELAICEIHLKYNIASVESDVREEKIRLQCKSDLDDIVFDNILNAVLLAFCTLYAFKTRSLPDNFNESKFIAFSCYATVMTWSAYLLIHYGSVLTEVSLSLGLTTSSLIIEMCIFVPKLYIILLRPEKNNRANFVTTKGIRIHVGSVDSTCATDHFIRRNSLRRSEIAS